MKRIWEKHEDELMHREYPNKKASEVAKLLGRSMRSVFDRAQALSIKKSEEFYSGPNSGRITKGSGKGESSRFKKGQSPPNKGNKLSEEQKKKMRFFPKGNIPANTKPEGSERVNIYGYIEVKVDGEYRYKNRLVYEKHYGPIPRGAIVKFRDGNKLNCAPENLYLSNRSKNMQDNTIHNYPIELKRAIRLVKKLKRKIKSAKQD